MLVAAPAITGAARTRYVTAPPSSFMANSKAPYMPRHEHTSPRARAPGRIARTMHTTLRCASRRSQTSHRATRWVLGLGRVEVGKGADSAVQPSGLPQIGHDGG